jgi:outer membrane lipoprotein-sorting protein
MKVRFFAVFAFLLTLSTSLAGAAPADQWIAKARAYVGTEGALDSVRSMHITGTLENEAGAKVPVDIICQKPNQRIIKLSFEKSVQQTTLDGYDGWLSNRDSVNPANWQLRLMDGAQIKRIRADNAETLNFFKGIEQHGGKVEFMGDATMEGHDTVKLAYIYGPGIIFYRYIDKATGRQVLVETESGVTIHEEGELIVDGIRFSKRIINRSADGKANILTIEKLTLNEDFPASLFAVPALITK